MITGLRSSTGSSPCGTSPPASRVPPQPTAASTAPTIEAAARRSITSPLGRRHLVDGRQQDAAREARAEGRGGAARIVGAAEAGQRLHPQRLALLAQPAILELARVFGDRRQRGGVLLARDRGARLPEQAQLGAGGVGARQRP